MKIIKTKDLRWQETSHIGSRVMKQVFIENGEMLNITTFGKAVFKPNQKVEEHKHPTMYEVFYVLSGKAEFIIEGIKNIIDKDEVVIIDPNELHSQSNPFDEDVEWLYFGLATDNISVV